MSLVTFEKSKIVKILKERYHAIKNIHIYLAIGGLCLSLLLPLCVFASAILKFQLPFSEIFLDFSFDLFFFSVLELAVILVNRVKNSTFNITSQSDLVTEQELLAWLKRNYNINL
jgi:hypothetical protein